MPKEEFLIVKKARNGNGVFTTRAFGKNEPIFEVKGKLITCDEEDDIDEEARANTYQ